LRAMSCPPGKRVTISKLLRIKALRKTARWRHLLP